MIYQFSILSVKQSTLSVNHMPCTVEADNEYEAEGLAIQVARQCYPDTTIDVTLQSGPIVTKENVKLIGIV